MNSILDEHAPLKWINKYKLKFKSKHWITPVIQKFITLKNNLLKTFKNVKDLQTKQKRRITEDCIKDYRNMLSALKKNQNKSNYYNQYFRVNMNNIRITWKGIKSIITTKNLSSDIPKILSSSGSIITNQVEISNNSKLYFSNSYQ